MSFLYDEEVYGNIIVKAFSKVAQEILSKPVSDVAKKLVRNISTELSGDKKPINISSGSPIPVDLNVNQLQNLGKLLQFLTNNQIRIDGTRIVFTEAENNILSEEEKNKLSPVSVNVSRDVGTRKWNTADFYTNLPLLIKYVSYLQQKANTLKNNGEAQGRILEVMIGKIIDSINSIKSDSGLTRAPKSQPDKPNVIPEETVLDNFGTKLFDIKNPYLDQGPIKLTAKNLTSRESLNAWMQGGGEFGPETQVVMYDIANQPKQILYSNINPEPNLCFVINILYLRAKRMLKLSKSSEDTKRYNFFVNRINELGPSFADPQGKACTIGDTAIPSKMTGMHGFMDQKYTTDSVPTTISPQIIEQIVQSLPLDTQDIDFNRIKNFFNLYARIASKDNAAAVYTSIGEAHKAMNTVVTKTSTGVQQNFRITRNVQELLTWLQPPAGNNALVFLYALQQVIVETGKVITIFYNEYARTIYSKDRQVLNGEQKSLVESQILGGNSIYSQNLRDIQSLIANFQSVVGMKR